MNQQKPTTLIILEHPDDYGVLSGKYDILSLKMGR